MLDYAPHHAGAKQMDTQRARTEDVLQRIRAEYLELPGLRLTIVQAQRLWGLDRAACDSTLTKLVEARFLIRTPDGAFVRSDVSAPPRRRGGFGSVA